MKTSELIGAALTWVVAKADGREVKIHVEGERIYILDKALYEMCVDDGAELNYDTDWAQGGPIIDRERFQTDWISSKVNGDYCMVTSRDGNHEEVGETLLIAAMRCFCVSKLGDEVDIPKELHV